MKKTVAFLLALSLLLAGSIFAIIESSASNETSIKVYGDPPWM